MTITPEQVRAARQFCWTHYKLGGRVCASEKTIQAFEAGDPWLPPRSPPLSPEWVRARLESAGVEFIAESGGGAGVRLRKAAK